MPEEINRVLVDHLSDYLFAPTRTAVKHLRREGIRKGVHLTGDVLTDILPKCMAVAEAKSTVLADLGLTPKKYLLATIHREENTDDPVRLASIMDALSSLQEEVVFPCHPRTRERLTRFSLWDKLTEQIRVIPPVGYLEMLLLEKNAAKILTDSGGVQKEAYLFHVPCITLRDTTEWTETVEDGWNILVGADRDKIVESARTFSPRSGKMDAFGVRGASRQIRTILADSAEHPS
jgi:UDP-N-acetylglucosamine 2-epimerase (non-hydrolysing)